MTPPAAPEFSRAVAADALAPGARFEGVADAGERAALATRFGVTAVQALGFRAEAAPWGPGGVRLRGVAEAALTQTCVVTLEPVAATLAEPFERFFAPADRLAQAQALLGPDLDEAPEALGGAVDIGEIAAETVALAIDPYPRAPGAAFEGARSAPPGVAPLSDEQARPFAGLAALKARGDAG
jgi:uncharacterized metal-binding protein YceD (DUF177 family)